MTVTDQAKTLLERTSYAPFGAPFNRPVDGVGYTGHVMDRAVSFP